MKYNPFRPNGIVGPGMFVGRVEELNTIEQCLFQAKHGNPQHFLIEGERGIGKSSLLFFTEHVANGNVLTMDDHSLKFLTVSVDMGGVATQMDIVRTIARQLKISIGERETLKRTAGKVWEFLSKWEVLGVRYHGEDDADPEDARDELINRIIELLSGSATEIEGLFIIIDEADGPSEAARFGEFLKLFTERLTKRNCNSVLIGLAGLPSTIPKLRASHESSPRLLEIIRLDPLTTDERKKVVHSGLREAQQKNGFLTAINNDALDTIVELSEGYPHFIQQFSYFAFVEDSDNIIDVDDVMKGAYKENGALMQLGHKYFSEMYHAKISSEGYRNVLGTMAVHGDEWIPRQNIIRESKILGVSEANVTNALAALRERHIIILDETRRGYYKLPTRSFAAWINAVRSVQTKTDRDGRDLFSSGAS